jgi:hypothetical protein
MKAKTQSPGKSVRGVVLAAVLVMAASAGTSPAPRASGPAPDDLVLEYKMPAGRVLRYLLKDEVKESTDRMGETVETVVTASGTDTFRAKGRKNGGHLLEVTIEDSTLVISSPRGENRPDLKPIIGKSFDLVLSPLGVEVDVSGAEAITFTSLSGPRSVAPGYKVFFPDLPDKPIRVGQSWTTNSIVEEQAGTIAIRTEIQRINTIDGVETVEGLECLRITAKLTGRFSGSGNAQGTDIKIDGKITGTDVWHFAPKEGIYVRSNSDVLNEMTVTVTRGQTMTFPTTQKQKKTLTLAAR